MTLESDDLGKALQENLKLRRELATGLAEAQGEKLAAVRYRLARITGAIRYAFSGRSRRASATTAVVELMTLDGAREQYANQLRRLDKAALLKEIEQLRQLLTAWGHTISQISRRNTKAPVSTAARFGGRRFDMVKDHVFQTVLSCSGLHGGKSASV